MAMFMLYAFDSLWGWMQWTNHLTLCQKIIDRYEEIDIPKYSDKEDANPLVVYLETHVEKNVFRWCVFMLWLQTHPDGYKWFRVIQNTYRLPSLTVLEHSLL